VIYLIVLLLFLTFVIFHTVLLVFEQPGETPLKFDDQIPPPYLVNRNSFSARKFAAKYRFGEPIGVNYFYSIFTSTT
jgi:hypothetical protein